MTSVLRVLCLVVPGLTVLVAALLALTNSNGGFLPNLGRAIALMVLASGNSASWRLNLLYLWRQRGPRWLVVVTIIQTIPVLFVGAMLFEHFSSRRTFAQMRSQVDAVQAAIGADDVPGFERARALCRDLCLESLGGQDGLLMFAADTGALRVAMHLLKSPAPSPDTARRAAERSVMSCDDGQAIFLRHALSVSVARNNAAMLDLLLPSSGPDARRDAMWTAARLDRLAMMQRMVRAGVPINYRGQILDENSTLVVAAAEGAAVRVARWLIDEHRMPVNAVVNGPDPYTGVSPLRVLLSAERAALAAPRTAAFLQLLVAHGADINARWDAETPSALDEMVRRRNRPGVALLIGAGVDQARLTDARRDELRTLLAETEVPPDRAAPAPGCVASGD
jgi:hypothetical protein